MNLELWVKSLHGEAPGRLLWVCPGLEKLKVGGVEFGVESGGTGLERVVFVIPSPVRHYILSSERRIFVKHSSYFFVILPFVEIVHPFEIE